MTHDPRFDSSEYIYAGFWERCGAYIVDSLIIVALLVPFYYFEYQRWADVPLEQIPAYTLTDFLLTLVSVILVVWFWVKKGATPGKMLFGLEIRDLKTGQFVSIPKALLRYLVGYTISGLVLGLGFIWAAFDKKKQGWHDKISGTVVVRRIC